MAVPKCCPSCDLSAHSDDAQAVSSILHDLGWDNTGELISTDKRFEVDGAIAARNWIIQQQKEGKATDSWDEHRIQLLWDAIALHSTPSIAAHKESVVAMCTAGIAIDFQGPTFDPSGTMTMAEFDAVKAEFPSRGLAEGVRKIICGFCRTKPSTTYGQYSLLCRELNQEVAKASADNWQMEYGRRFVEDYKTEGNLVFDLVENCLP